MPAPPVLASVWRGDICEARLRGHVAVVDATGAVLAALGDAGAVTTLRSCVKPIQAVPFVRDALDQIGAEQDELAVACGSHNGEPRHVATVRRLLGRVGLDDAALACGPQPPFDEASARRLFAQGEEPGAVHNNCSGKHAAMLATCVVRGWRIDGYIAPDHPCQQAVTAALAEAMGPGLMTAPRAVDGCGLPTYAMPLSTLAAAFASSQADPAFGRCQDAMAARPFMVAGTGRFDTALLDAAGDRLTCKIGGAAVWVAAIRPKGPAVALKLEAGGDGVAPVAVAVLQRLGVLGSQLPEGLREFATSPLRNWARRVVGETRAEASVIGALTAPVPGHIVRSGQC